MVNLLEQNFLLFKRAPDLLLLANPLGDVAQPDRQHVLAGHREPGHGYLSRKIAAIAAPPHDDVWLARRTGGPEFTHAKRLLGQQIGKMAGKHGIDFLSQSLLPRIAEDRLGAFVEQRNGIAFIERDDRVLGNLNDAGEAGFRSLQRLLSQLPFGNVAQPHRHYLFTTHFELRDRGLGRKFRTVAAQRGNRTAIVHGPQGIARGAEIVHVFSHAP